MLTNNKNYSYDTYLISINISNQIKDYEIIDLLEYNSYKKKFIIVEKNNDNILLINNNNNSLINNLKNYILNIDKEILALKMILNKNPKTGNKIIEVYKIKGETKKILKFIRYIKQIFNDKLNNLNEINSNKQNFNKNQKIFIKENFSEFTEFTSSFINISKILNNLNYNIGIKYNDFINNFLNFNDKIIKNKELIEIVVKYENETLATLLQDHNLNNKQNSLVIKNSKLALHQILFEKIFNKIFNNYLLSIKIDIENLKFEYHEYFENWENIKNKNLFNRANIIIDNILENNETSIYNLIDNFKILQNEILKIIYNSNIEIISKEDNLYLFIFLIKNKNINFILCFILIIKDYYDYNNMTNNNLYNFLIKIIDLIQ